MVNASQEAMTFGLQERGATDWRRVIDTSRASPDDFRTPGDEVPVTIGEFEGGPRSVAVFIRPR
jgi:hypothetical protein